MTTINEQNRSLESIHIKGLFDIFDYDIEFSSAENVLILTGANGFGKTQVLNIIYNLFNRKFSFFKKLVFTKITIFLSGNIEIKINRINSIQEQNELFYNNEQVVQDYLEINFSENEHSFDSCKIETIFSQDEIDRLENYLPIAQLDSESWFDHSSDEIIHLEQLLERYLMQLPQRFRSNIETKSLGDKANNILDSINVHLIEEQRLFKKVYNQSVNGRNRFEKNQTVMMETVKAYADELTKLINEKMRESFSITQELDRSYPRRLISIEDKVSETEYDERFITLSEKIDKLVRNGLYEGKQEKLAYKEADSKALSVYMNDLEKKLSVFDGLLEKLELFTSILNERRFTFKSIIIDKEKGFYFQTDRDKKLLLSDLSSGEQHELVLLYELIFRTDKGNLVLIDEPEISLHITWQKGFLDDLLKIIKLQGFQVILATHSPSIINDRWDLVYTLEKQESTGV